MDHEASILSQNEDTEGFNIDCGKTWIYPTNLPIREYQHNIVQEALLKNTMVCLPTGLGKTFIAAVVMYNYFRWYPNGKIIFMAPTKPLVKQQVEACYNIMAIPKEATAELTGTTAQSSRDDIWDEKRVFFITPQVLQNDLERIVRLAKQIKCLVFDEAHKARGNHAYCEIIKKINPISKHFRVLALTATPGSTISDVVKVCNDLLISHLEIRTETNGDVAPYVFKKNIETLVVPLDSKLCQVRDDYIQVLDKYVRVLIENRVVQGNCSSLTKGRLFYIKKEYEEKNKLTRGPQHNEIMKNLSICLILYHAYEVLTKHGLRGFLMFFKDHEDKPLLRNNYQIKGIMDDVSEYLGPIPVVDMLPDGTIPGVPQDSKFGHPKFYKLVDIIKDHFNARGQTSRVIVFCEYRESVMEAYTILLMHRPLIKPRIFLGQGTITQKQQLNVIQSFKSGDCNTLVSTSIGEEGLDIGDVNLVVCFDISNKSSIRMIQRIGRTGRKQDGNVIMLVTEGKEQQLLQESFAHKDYMMNAMKSSRELLQALYPYSPRMIPNDIKPVCNKMYITVMKSKQKLKNNDLKSMFNSMNQNLNYDDVELVNFEDRIPTSGCYFNKTWTDILNNSSDKCMYSVEKNRVLQSQHGRIGSSSDSQILVSLLEFANSKRFNIPMSQTNALNKQTTKSDKFKQSDIRTLFQKQQSSQKSQSDYQRYDNSNNENVADGNYNKEVLKEFHSELNEYLSGASLKTYNCLICDNLFLCNNYKNEVQKLEHWLPPEMTMLDCLTKDSLSDFVDSLINKNNKPNRIDFDEFDDIFAELDLNNEQLQSVLKDDVISIKNNKGAICSDETTNTGDEDLFNIDDEWMGNIDLTPLGSCVKFDMPKSAAKLLQGYKENDSICEVIDESQSTKVAQLMKLLNNTLQFFKLTDIQECFNFNVSKSPVLLSNKDNKSLQEIVVDKSSDVTSEFPDMLETKFQDRMSQISVDYINKVNEPTALKKIPEKQEKHNSLKMKNVKNNSIKLASKKESHNYFSLNDICDSSILNLLSSTKIDKSESTSKNNATKTLDLTDIIDSSILDDLKLPLKNTSPVLKRFSSNEDPQIKKSKLKPLEISSSSKGSQTNESKSKLKFGISSKPKSSDISEKQLQMKSSKKLDHPNNSHYNIETSPILCSYEENIRKSRLQLSQVRDKNKTSKLSTGIKETPKPNANLNLKDIFADDFLKDIMNLKKSPINKHHEKPCSQAVKNNNTGKFDNLEKMCMVFDMDDDFSFDEKTANISQDLDKTILVSPETRSKFSKINSSPTSVINLDNSNSPILSSYRYNRTITMTNKAQSQASEYKSITPAKECSGSDELFDFSYEDLQNNKTLKVNTPNKKYDDLFEIGCKNKSTRHSSPDLFEMPSESSGTSKENYAQNLLSTPKNSSDKQNIKPSKLSTKKCDKPLTLDDICSTSVLNLFKNVDKVVKEQRKNMSLQKYNETLKWCKENKIQNTKSQPINGSFIQSHTQPNNILEKKKANLNTLQTSSENENFNIDSPNKSNVSLTSLSSPNFCSTQKPKSKLNNTLKIDSILDKYLGSSPQKKGQYSSSYQPRHSPLSIKKKLIQEKKQTLKFDDDDSDFDDCSIMTPRMEKDATSKRKHSSDNCIVLSSDEDFETSCIQPKKKPNKSKQPRKNKKKNCEFLEAEAALSSDANVSSDERSGSSQDIMEASFVNDETFDLGNATMMHAHYVQSARSPVYRKGAFKIPQLPVKINSEIFSQPVIDDQNTYLEDSFCVISDDEDTEEELSELEIAERILKERKRKKSGSTSSKPTSKRRRILQFSDSD